MGEQALGESVGALLKKFVEENDELSQLTEDTKFVKLPEGVQTAIGKLYRQHLSSEIIWGWGGADVLLSILICLLMHVDAYLLEEKKNEYKYGPSIYEQSQ